MKSPPLFWVRCPYCGHTIGLATELEMYHRKFMHMIVVYCDITAPLYWWKEFDTYKVGTVRYRPSSIGFLNTRFQMELLLHLIKTVNYIRKPKIKHTGGK